MTVLRKQAEDALLAIYGVDLHDWTVSDDSRAMPAMVVIEIQLEIMTAQERGNAGTARLTMLGQGDRWQMEDASILSYAMDVSRDAHLIRTLIRLRDLGIAPYLPRKEQS